MKHIQAVTWTGAPSNQSQKKRKPPLRFFDHGGVFAYHKALTAG
jgi:hypothetical protein